MLDIPLEVSFRYVHEPLSTAENVLPPLANEPMKKELQNRLRHSRGGTFLITGFRGVGKSTLVLRAIEELVGDPDSAEIILPVSLSVARSTSTERLMFAIVRRIFESLSDSEVFEKLSPDVRHALLLAYMRTSLAFKQSQSDATQNSAGLNLGPGSASAKAGLARIIVPTVNLSAQRSKSLATEASFLAYSETDAEYDLMRIITLVNREAAATLRQSTGLGRLWPWRRRKPFQLRLVIVLDEVDKLTAGEVGLAAVEDLSSGIKNVLTTSGAHFLIVAGPDLHDRAVRDSARGNGVYESVFGWRMYVPCSWEAPEQLLKSLIPVDADYDQADLQSLLRYLQFKARGVLRRLLQEFNELVTWDDDDPYLRISETDAERIRFYARLEEILDEYFQRARHGSTFPIPIDQDRWRLGSYYVFDWVLQSRGDPFSSAELWREGEDSSFDPLLRISRRNISHLLDHLAANGILEVIRDGSPNLTLIGDVPESQAKVYALAASVRSAIYGFALHHESERIAGDVSLVGIGPREISHRAGSDATEVPATPPLRVLSNRYELSRLIGQGGMGSVYAGHDQLTGLSVAVKVLRPPMTTDAQAIARVRREIDIAIRLAHPQLVRSYGTAEGPDGSPALVMELLDGPTLEQLVSENGRLEVGEVVEIADRLAGVLTYLASQQVVRLDLKPSNVIMDRVRGPIIIDLGIARMEAGSRDTITGLGQFVGTPMYIAPELVAGDRADERADLFTLGLVLYYCLVGRSPWGENLNPLAVLRAVLERPVNVNDVPVSGEFRSALSKLLAINPDDRFRNAEEFRRALVELPEWDNDPEAELAPRRTGDGQEGADYWVSVPLGPLMEEKEDDEYSRSAVVASDLQTSTDPPPIIMGVYCVNGHFQDPEVNDCTVCGVSMNLNTIIPRPGPRPNLGVLLFDDGTAYMLDRDYIIGREPSLDAAVASGRARGLRLDDGAAGYSPTDYGSSDDLLTISRVHAKISLDGWRVLLTDLNSANGTRVKLPTTGGELALAPNVPVVLTSGSQINLGARSFRYESHRGDT